MNGLNVIKWISILVNAKFSVSHARTSLLDFLPFAKFFYMLNDVFLDYTNSEIDLGIHVNTRLNWSEHCDKLYSMANGKLGLVKNTCHFSKNQNHKRSLYLALVRSQFEHCSIIWRPFARTIIDKLESIQKRLLNGSYRSWTLDTQNNSISLNVSNLTFYLLNIDLSSMTLFLSIK